MFWAFSSRVTAMASASVVPATKRLTSPRVSRLVLTSFSSRLSVDATRRSRLIMCYLGLDGAHGVRLRWGWVTETEVKM